jgi:N-acetylmuramoyl-L-alanine amidase
LDEVDESRRVVAKVADYLRNAHIKVSTFNDDVSRSVAANLNAIIGWHNSQKRDLDVSIHFNDSGGGRTSRPIGTETLFVSQQALARHVSAAITYASGLIDRGPKKRTNLAFLNRSKKPALLLEICFVNSQADADLYRKNVDAIAKAIAGALK